MHVDSVSVSFDAIDLFEEKKNESMWNGKLVSFNEEENDQRISIKKFSPNQILFDQHKGKVRKFGEGSYEVKVDKDTSGNTNVSGNVSYESDNGTKASAEVKVDDKGNTSGSVSIGGKF